MEVLFIIILKLVVLSIMDMLHGDFDAIVTIVGFIVFIFLLSLICV